MANKPKEELLAEEVRAAADGATKIFQWGVTLMITIQTSLYFVRRDILQGLIGSKKLPEGSDLPWHRYLVGTFFLLVVALILSRLSARMTMHYRHYKAQLLTARESGIVDLPIARTGRWVTWLYFVFPVMDIVFRAYRVYIEVKFE